MTRPSGQASFPTHIATDNDAKPLGHRQLKRRLTPRHRPRLHRHRRWRATTPTMPPRRNTSMPDLAKCSRKDSSSKFAPSNSGPISPYFCKHDNWCVHMHSHSNAHMHTDRPGFVQSCLSSGRRMRGPIRRTLHGDFPRLPSSPSLLANPQAICRSPVRESGGLTERVLVFVNPYGLCVDGVYRCVSGMSDICSGRPACRWPLHRMVSGSPGWRENRPGQSSSKSSR
jgi:hypothetical protein